MSGMKWKVYRMILRPAVIGGLVIGGPGSGRIEDAKVFTVTKTSGKKEELIFLFRLFSLVLFCSLLCYSSLPIKW